MKRVVFLIFIMFLFINVKALPLPVNVTADSALVLNLDEDTVVYEKNGSKEQILASLTKIMTVHVALQHIDDIKQKITITSDDIKDLVGFTCVGLTVGAKVTYEDLLYGTILYSGADTAQALAYHIAGSPKKFVELMNEEAKRLSLKNTNFADTYGGDDANISTAKETAKLLQVALQNNQFKKIFTTTQYKMSNNIPVINYTRSIATFHGLDDTLITGNKSGYTPEAGLLLASTSTINNTNYVIVVMKSNINSYLSSHVLDTYRILDFLKTKTFERRIILEKGLLLKNAKVYNSTIDEYQIHLTKDISVFLPIEEFSRIEIKYDIVDTLDSKTRMGDNIGFIDVMLDNEVIYTEPIYLQDKIYELKDEENKLKLLIPLATLIVSFISFLIISTKLFIKYLKTRTSY